MSAALVLRLFSFSVESHTATQLDKFANLYAVHDATATEQHHAVINDMPNSIKP